MLLNDTMSQVIEASSVDEQGFPADNPSSTHPSVVMSNPDKTVNTGFISSLENWGSETLNAVGAGMSAGIGAVDSTLQDALDATGHGISETYGFLKSESKAALTEVENVTSFATGQVVLVVAAVGIALYFVMKTGGLKILV